MKWNNDVFKHYMEAGLAVLIVLTLGLPVLQEFYHHVPLRVSRLRRLPGMTAQMPVKKMRIRIL